MQDQVEDSLLALVHYSHIDPTRHPQVFIIEDIRILMCNWLLEWEIKFSSRNIPLMPEWTITYDGEFKYESPFHTKCSYKNFFDRFMSEENFYKLLTLLKLEIV